MAGNRLETNLTAKDRTRKAFSSFNNRLKSSRINMKGLALAVGGFVTIAGAMRLKELTTEALRFGSQIQLTADKIGVTTTNLQALRLVGEQVAGVQSNTLDMALQRFSRRLGEADQGTGELLGTLNEFGISTRNSDGSVKSVTDTLVEYADAVDGAESEQQKLLMAFKAFDSEGAVLKELLAQGGDALKAFMDKAKASGAIMSGTMTQGAKKLNAELALQSKVIKTQLSEAFISLAPKILAVMGFVARLSTGVNNLFKSAGVKFTESLEGTEIEALKLQLEELRKAEEEASNRAIKATGGHERRTEQQALARELALYTSQAKEIEELIALKLKDNRVTFQKTSFIKHLSTQLKKLSETTKLSQTQAQQFAQKFHTGLIGAFDAVIEGTKSVGASLKDLGRTLVKEAIRMIIFRTIIAPFTGMVGGFLDKLGFKASGGSVSKGRPYIVGERGAELFVPNSSGSIVPNHQMGGVVINQNINLSTGVQATVRSEIIQMLPLLSQASVGAVAESRRRGAS